MMKIFKYKKINKNIQNNSKKNYKKIVYNFK